MSCCPEGAWGYTKEEYGFTGTLENLEDMRLYHKGSENPKKCVMIFFDIFGFDAGRHKNVVDYFADQGYFVVMPDFFRGDGHDPNSQDFIATVNKYPIEGIAKDVDATMAWAKAKGAETFAYIGFCYGCWAAFRTIGDRFVCGVNYHPSCKLEAFLGGDDVGLVKKVKGEMLFFPTKQDDDYYRDGGAYLKSLHEAGFTKSFSIDYPEQDHGFLVRGDMTNEAVSKAVVKAMAEGSNFLKSNLNA